MNSLGDQIDISFLLHCFQVAVDNTFAASLDLGCAASPRSSVSAATPVAAAGLAVTIMPELPAAAFAFCFGKISLMPEFFTGSLFALFLKNFPSTPPFLPAQEVSWAFLTHMPCNFHHHAWESLLSEFSLMLNEVTPNRERSADMGSEKQQIVIALHEGGRGGFLLLLLLPLSGREASSSALPSLPLSHVTSSSKQTGMFLLPSLGAAASLLPCLPPPSWYEGNGMSSASFFFPAQVKPASPLGMSPVLPGDL